MYTPRDNNRTRNDQYIATYKRTMHVNVFLKDFLVLLIRISFPERCITQYTVILVILGICIIHKQTYITTSTAQGAVTHMLTWSLQVTVLLLAVKRGILHRKGCSVCYIFVLLHMHIHVPVHDKNVYVHCSTCDPRLDVFYVCTFPICIILYVTWQKQIQTM